MIALSQPTLILVGSLAFAVLATTAIATIPECRRGCSVRRVGLVALPIVLVALGCAIVSTGRWNVTASMPIGFYRVVARPRVLARGMLVAVCAPPLAAKQGRERGYLGDGPCADNTEPLLKTVAALAGDTVTALGDGIRVNGHLLPNSRVLRVDRAGRTLAPSFDSRLVLPTDTMWAYANHPRSWDSRYWGAIPVRAVLAQMRPLAVLRGGSAP